MVFRKWYIIFNGISRIPSLQSIGLKSYHIEKMHIERSSL